jgi:L-amino acid N-acyltransferase YncA
MPTYKLEAFPRTLELLDGTTVELRPMERGDEDGLLQFFLQVPEEDRYFLKDDVTSPRVIESWTSRLDYDRALPILACSNGAIVANAVLVRSRRGARSHIGELRVVVQPSFRGKGLGSAMMRQLCDIAADAELEKVVIELAEDRENEALQAAERLGFIRAATIPEYFRDQHGRPHDLVVLVLPLGKWYEWWTF